MVNWMKVIGEHFTIDYLLLALCSEEDMAMVETILRTYGYPEDVAELVVDYISFKKVNLDE